MKLPQKKSLIGTRSGSTCRKAFFKRSSFRSVFSFRVAAAETVPVVSNIPMAGLLSRSYSEPIPPIMPCEELPSGKRLSGKIRENRASSPRQEGSPAIVYIHLSAMKCPSCHEDNDRVIDSRASHDGFATRRRRVCSNCGLRYTTYERIEGAAVKVIKKDGTRQPFDRMKIKRGLELACWKRPVSDAQLESIVTEVQNELESHSDPEIESREVGELVMKYLRGGRPGGLRPFRQRLSAVRRRTRLRPRTEADVGRSQAAQRTSEKS